jgi:rSAM/selenodomain-associated transferase 2
VSLEETAARTTRVSVIVPALNEEAAIAAALASAADADEVIVVDGGSTDRTREIARRSGARVLESARGRGLQQNEGAAAARGDVLLFLHADTVLPTGFREQVLDSLNDGRAAWGRFDVHFDAGGPLLRLIARLISLRSRISRVATGDQAIFVRTALFERLGGFTEQELFEDIDLCRRLKRAASMAVPPGRVITSARRWRVDGPWRTSFLMWGMKLAYLAGVPPHRLVRFYRNVR